MDVGRVAHNQIKRAFKLINQKITQNHILKVLPAVAKEFLIYLYPINVCVSSFPQNLKENTFATPHIKDGIIPPNRS
jgi:hypothetical protein